MIDITAAASFLLEHGKNIWKHLKKDVKFDALYLLVVVLLLALLLIYSGVEHNGHSGVAAVEVAKPFYIAPKPMPEPTIVASVPIVVAVPVQEVVQCPEVIICPEPIIIHDHLTHGPGHSH